MTFRPPQAILFDLDGTLLDSLPGIAYSIQRAFEDCALPIPEGGDIRSRIGPPIRTILSQLAGDIPVATLDHLEQAFRISYDTEGWRRTPHYPVAAETLRAIRSHGIRIFIVSNKPIHIATCILETEGTFDLIEAILTRDSRTPPYANKLAMMQDLIATHQLDPKRCLMVGDTMEDAHAASNIPMKFAFMTHGYGDVPESGPVPVAMRLNHFSDFLQKLTKEFAQ